VSVQAEFVASAARASDLPWDGAPEIALVGRSNVGKSSIINALAARKVARTSATPGKTRTINIYRVDGRSPAFYIVDLPGYGYAPGGESVRSFQALARVYADSRWREGREEGRRPRRAAALLLVDVRHPGLDNDLAAYDWLADLGPPAAVVGTKVDKLTRAERSRARYALETAFNGPVLPVSAASGEGLKELWKLIDRLLSNQPSKLTPRSR
jgi:GTP-binding protein